MSKKIVEFPDRKAIEEEAGAWLIKLDGDSAPSAADLASLREWLGRSPVHREQLHSLADFWGRMNVLTELAVPLGNADSGGSRGFFDSLRHAMPYRGRTGFVAAVAVIVLGIGIAVTVGLRPDPFLGSNGFYTTAVGQQQSTTLADGSIVMLNTNSQIRVEYNGEFRNTYLLQGEAHFTVEKDAEHPFRVYAGNERVQAVGTAFSVYLKDNSVDVTVTDGKVALASRVSGNRAFQQDAPSGSEQSSGSSAVFDGDFVEALGTIKAGESITIQSDFGVDPVSAINSVETVAAPEMAKRLSWRDGVLTFSGDPLEVVADEISRYTTVSIEFSDPAVRATRIGGRFPIGETDAMFDALEANFGLRVTRLSDNRVLVSAIEE